MFMSFLIRIQHSTIKIMKNAPSIFHFKVIETKERRNEGFVGSVGETTDYNTTTDSQG